MKNLETHKHKGYTYHVAKNGDFYVACKKNKGKYIGFTGVITITRPKETIDRLIFRDENDFPLFSRKEILEDAEMIAKDPLYESKQYLD